MEKKQYIKPELMVEELETVEMIAMSMYDEEGDDSYANNRNFGRRGQWGNLWFTED